MTQYDKDDVEKIGLVKFDFLGLRTLTVIDRAVKSINKDLENSFREGVTVHRGTIQDKGLTKIGSNNLLMAYTHIAHDCCLGHDNVFANNAGIAGHVSVGNNITVGALTTVHQFCKLGDFSFVGMNTSINMNEAV